MNAGRIARALGFSAVALSYPAAVGWSLPNWVPEGYRSSVNEAMREAGGRGSELEAFLSGASPEQREAACFLVSNLPRVDLVRADRRVLGEHLEYAFKAKRTLPWGETVPNDLFLHYVVAPRCTQEPLEAWRRYFYEQLYPAVRELPSIGDAALAVNRWCGERVKYKYTQPRDQGPFETLKSGYGRCEEMTIVLICALRSVGIPAREAYTPYWPFQDDNHAWTEAWVDGTWKFMGSCEPADGLCQAWFADPAKRAAVVFAPVFGVPRDTTGLYRKFTRSAIAYATNLYTKTGTLKIMLTEGGKASRKARATISVFNYGALREIADLESDSGGEARIEIGDGTYFVSAGKEGRCCWEVVVVKKGEDTEVHLDLLRSRPLEANFWLRYAPQSEAE